MVTVGKEQVLNLKLQVCSDKGLKLKCQLMVVIHRVHVGHGKPGKSLNLRISFSRPRKSWKIVITNG